MDDSTEEIRKRADIVEIVGQYAPLRPSGPDRWKACCPFHDEKTPSFYVSRDKGFYKCFGCGVSGDVFKFLQAVENVSFFEAKKTLAERYGVVLRASRDITPEQKAVYDERDRLLKVMAAAAHFFREQLEGNAGLAARDYVRSRGLSRETVEKFGIGYAPDAWDTLRLYLFKKYGFSPEDCAAAGLLVERKTDDAQHGGIFEAASQSHYYDRYRHRLMFPIWDERGRCIAFGGRALEGGRTGNPDAKYINSPEGALFKKSRVLYAFHIARPEVPKRESVLITEGYMDAIALHEGGFAHTVATLGTALTVQHVQLLKRIAPKVVYLCYDGDSAGMNAALRAAPLFAANDLDVRVVSLPNGDDPDTFIRHAGAIGFENALREAKFLGQYRLEMAIKDFDLSQVADRMEAVRAASEIVAEVENPTEKDAYTAWIADKWKGAEGITSPARFAMVEAAVRREVEAAQKRRKRPVNTAPAPATREAARQEESEALSETLQESVGLNASGVVKAERALLSTILGSPSWRTRVLEELPPARWTQEVHAEIASALGQLPADETISPPALLEKLSPQSGGLLGELMLSDDAQSAASEPIIRDYIARVQGHWARQVEREILELIKLKLQNGEAISREEHAAYHAALTATRRKSVA